MKVSKKEYDEIKKELKKILKPKDTIYSIIRHVSNSGMQRCIDFYVIKNNRPVRLTWYLPFLLGYPINKKHGGITVKGWGVDMCFSVVYELGQELYGKRKIKGTCSDRGKYSNFDSGYAFESEIL